MLTSAPLLGAPPLSHSAIQPFSHSAALKRLFERKADSPRLFRHEIYNIIAEREPEAWALYGNTTQRERLESNSNTRHDESVVHVWARAMKEALDGFEFGSRVKGSKNEERPNGYWTTELAKL